MRALKLLFVLVLVSVLDPAPARADLLSFYAQVQTGGSSGLGLAGDAKNQSFFDKTSGFTYGFLVGAEVFFLDIAVEHDQFLGKGGFLGTWTQFTLGLDTEIGFGERRDALVDQDGYYKGGYHVTFLEVRGKAGFGVGTLEFVDPPLRNEQVDDKGFVTQLEVGVGYRFNPYLSVGASVPIEVAYLFKSGVINDAENRYAAMGFGFLINFRGQFVAQ